MALFRKCDIRLCTFQYSPSLDWKNRKRPGGSVAVAFTERLVLQTNTNCIPMMRVGVLVKLNEAFPVKRRERSVAVDLDEDRLLRAVMERAVGSTAEWVSVNECI